MATTRDHEIEVARIAAPYLPYFKASLNGAPGQVGVEAVNPGEPAALDKRFGLAEETIEKLAAEVIRNPGASAEFKAQILAARDQLLRDARIARKIVGPEQVDVSGLAPEGLQAALEVIVRTDGSRPAFLVQRDRIIHDPAQPAAAYAQWQFVSKVKANLEALLPAIGRIGPDPGVSNDGQFFGTGFLVAPNVILTNRHVAEAIAGAPTLPTDDKIKATVIDFGREFADFDLPDGLYRANVRPLKRLLFAGPKPINDRIGGGLGLLDVVAFEVGDPESDIIGTQIPINIGYIPQILESGSGTAVVGYPKIRPQATELAKAADLIFSTRLGRKLVAPGLILAQDDSSVARTNPGSIEHDASTLGGNSGSPMIEMQSGRVAFGIHYGGFIGDARSNCGHVFGEVLDMPGDPTLPFRTLRELTGNVDPQRKVTFLGVPPSG